MSERHLPRQISGALSALWASMPPVQTLTLNEIEAAVRASWGPETAYASAPYMARGREHPSRGQCGTTALVVQDLLGGDLMVADVACEGQVEGVHYWNAMPGGVELDLTRDQFTAGESLVDPRRVTSGRNTSATAGERAFQLLRERVTAALRRESCPPCPPPVDSATTSS